MTATLRQGKKIAEIFEDLSNSQLQAILESGFLTDLRDVPDITKVNREEVRRSLGLPPFLLTPTTFGSVIEPPFVDNDANGKSLWTLINDGSGDEAMDVSRLQLIPILQPGEPRVLVEEAVRRGRANPEANWGQRAMEKVWAARESIPTSVWPVGKYALFTKTVWRHRDGGVYVWCVGRDAHGWCRYYCGLGDDLGTGGVRPSLRK